MDGIRGAVEAFVSIINMTQCVISCCSCYFIFKIVRKFLVCKRWIP